MKKNDHESYDVSVWIGWICEVILDGMFIGREHLSVVMDPV